MDFSINEEQSLLCDVIVDFSKNRLNGGVAERDREASFPEDLWAECGKMNLFSVPFAENHGGCGSDYLTTVLCVEALSYACRDSGLVHSILTQVMCGIVLDIYGSKEQKQKYLPRICTGASIAAQAATEADAGSDVFSMRTNAVKKGDSYVLNGTKMYISNGPIADVILVLALTNPKRKGFASHSMFLVEKGNQGFSTGNAMMKMGLRTLQNSDMSFTDCAVPLNNLVGKEGQGSFIFNEIMEFERIIFAACHVGVMKRIIEDCTEHAKEREQFGQNIGKFQLVANKIARMKMKVELARLMVLKAAHLKDNKGHATMEASTLKVFASESLKETCLDAIQIHGAYGYMSESEIERELRDSIASTIYSGTVEVNTMIIAKLLGL